MRHIANIRLRLATFLLLMGGALTWTSCSDDVGYDVENNAEKEVTVRLSISAGDSGGISVTRADDYTDVNALEGEYMNTLCVFVVDASGVIVEKLTPATSDDGWAGTWPEWTSDALTLATGSYTVYAFSNWETVDNESWNAIIALDEGASLTDNDLNFDIDDPASLVDLTNADESLRKYIPMSGMRQFDVTESATFDVGMDRLVGRVEITIYGETGTDAEDVTLNTLTFGNWANIVPLMKDGTASETITYEKSHTEEFTDVTLYAVSSGDASSESFYFYVNETYLGEDNHFDITLSTTRGSVESSYTASTNTTSIPRNNILPIYLTLSSYTLNLNIHAYTSAIGTPESEYTNVTSDENDNCIIELLTVTTMFTMSPTIKNSDGTEVSNVTWTWAKTGSTETDNISLDVDDTGMCTFTNLTATTGHVYTFSLTAEWTNTSGVTQTRTYNIQITLVNERPQRNNAPAHSSWQGWYWDREQLNMYRRH